MSRPTHAELTAARSTIRELLMDMHKQTSGPMVPPWLEDESMRKFIRRERAAHTVMNWLSEAIDDAPQRHHTLPRAAKEPTP